MKPIHWYLKAFKNPRKAFWVLFAPLINRINDDELFIKVKWRLTMDYPLNLKEPITFNEKVNWLKLYDRKPEYTLMVDKYRVKDYIADKIGHQYIIPTIGVWDNPDDVDFNALPKQFVLKCNHNSGRGMIICKDKGSLDIEQARFVLRSGIKEDYYRYNREWPYKNVPRKIIAEKYMEDDEYKYLRDFKFFCFNGIVRALFIATNRHLGDHETRFDFFDENFNHTISVVELEKHGDKPKVDEIEKTGMSLEDFYMSVISKKEENNEQN